MFVVIAWMGAGILAGYLLRGKGLRHTGQAVTFLVWLLLFTLGVEAGSNERIVQGLCSIGWDAFLLAMGGTSGSVLAAWGLWHLLNRKGKVE